MKGRAELVFKSDIDLGRRRERGCALEQPHGGAVVLAAGGAGAGGRQMLMRGGGGAVVRSPELGQVAVGLLEVMSEQLVELGELGPVVLEPACVAFVEVGTRGFGEGVVRHVADQQVPEAEPILARDFAACPV